MPTCNPHCPLQAGGTLETALYPSFPGGRHVGSGTWGKGQMRWEIRLKDEERQRSERIQKKKKKKKLATEHAATWSSINWDAHTGSLLDTLSEMDRDSASPLLVRSTTPPIMGAVQQAVHFFCFFPSLWPTAGPGIWHLPSDPSDSLWMWHSRQQRVDPSWDLPRIAINVH